jgi:hypothetical protein
VVVGEVASLILYRVLAAGGPILPFTAVFAPIAIVVEIWGDTLTFGLFTAGPLLFGLYGFFAAGRRSALAWYVLACFHLACFGLVSWLRDTWPWR